MARRVKNTTAKAGTTASDRRVLSGVSAITTAPSAKTDGFLMEQNEIIHLLFTVGGTSPIFRIRIWWWSNISSAWHKGKQVVVNASDIVTVETEGLDKIDLQVETTPSGTSPTLDAWIALVRPV